jgi:hypothetical protein
LGNEMEGEAAVDERLVWYALKQFQRDHLLEEKLDIPEAVLTSMRGGVGRRRMLRVLGLTALVALPLVTSMASPDAGSATSCLGPGASCSTSVQCCNGLCNSGTCN